MGAIIKFLEQFLSQFFVKGVWGIIKGIGIGIKNIFDIPKYIAIFKAWSGDFGVVEWIVAILALLVLLTVLVGLASLLYMLLRKYVRFRKTVVDQEELLNEVATLNRDVIRLTTEKEKILAMKVSQLGLKPGESPFEEIPEEGEEGEASSDDVDMEADDYSRFYKLTQVDLEIEDYEAPVYNNDITLPEICDLFRNFAFSSMGLYCEPRIIRLFLAAFYTS